jgi:hypothetical protein
MKRLLNVLAFLAFVSAKPAFASSLNPDAINPNLGKVSDAIPIYWRGSLPDASVDLSDEGTVSKITVYGAVPLEAVFDVIAGTLTSAPLPLPHPRLLLEAGTVGHTLSPSELAELNEHRRHSLFFRFCDTGPVKPVPETEKRRVHYVPHLPVRPPSQIQLLNTQARESWLAKRTIHWNAGGSDVTTMDRFESDNPSSDCFLFNSIPVSILHRYPGVMQPEEVCSLDNIRSIDKSFFKFPECSLEEAKSKPEWTQYFERLEHPDYPASFVRFVGGVWPKTTPEGVQRDFEIEKVRRDAAAIIKNHRFRSLCSSWETFFKTHTATSKEELIAKRDQLDIDFSEMLKK